MDQVFLLMDGRDTKIRYYLSLPLVKVWREISNSRDSTQCVRGVMSGVECIVRVTRDCMKVELSKLR